MILVVAVAVEGISGTVCTYLSSFYLFYQCNLPCEHLPHQFQLMKMNDMNVFMYSTLICLNIVVFEIH